MFKDYLQRKYFNFEKLLNKDNSVLIHYNNIHALALEWYKIANDVSPKIMNEVFQLRDTPCKSTAYFTVLYRSNS